MIDQISPSEAGTKLANAARSNLPQSIRNMGGRLLYTPVATLCSDSPVYFLGINPGSSPGPSFLHNTVTLDYDIDRVERDEICDNAFLDESWSNATPGYESKQQKVQHIFTIISYGDRTMGNQLLRKTPASNILLIRKEDRQSLKNIMNINIKNAVHLFWSVHKTIIEIKKPKIVLTHALTDSRNLMGSKTPIVFESGWTPGANLDKILVWELEEGPYLVAMPNLSRYDPYKEREDALRNVFQSLGVL